MAFTGKSGPQILKEGGPAFPNYKGDVDGGGDCPSGWEGMTLRDWFAGQALASLTHRWGESDNLGSRRNSAVFL